MRRLLIAGVFVVFVSASHESCLAQTNITSVCLLGWGATSISNESPVTLTWAYGAPNAQGIGVERSTSAAGPWLLALTKSFTASYDMMFLSSAPIAAPLGIAVWAVPLPRQSASMRNSQP